MKGLGKVPRSFIAVIRTPDFLSDVTAALCGTLIAAILGIFIAFWYDAYKREIERSERESIFLSRISCELNDQKFILHAISVFDSTTAGVAPPLNLNMAIWDASKGSEYIQSVADARVLNSIAWAYKALTDVDRLVTRLQDFYYGPGANTLGQSLAAAVKKTMIVGEMKGRADEAAKFVDAGITLIKSSGVAIKSKCY